MTFIANVTASTAMHAPKYLPSMYELRRTLHGPEADGAMLELAGHGVEVEKRDEQRREPERGDEHHPEQVRAIGQALAGVRRVPVREELLLRVVPLEACRQGSRWARSSHAKSIATPAAARDAQRGEHNSLHAAKALAELARRDELDLGERAHGRVRCDGRRPCHTLPRYRCSLPGLAGFTLPRRQGRTGLALGKRTRQRGDL